jgi:hypothetical protein
MGYEARKTEHCGAKHGNGAYGGRKWEAKKESNRIRRENAKGESTPAPAMPPRNRQARRREPKTTAAKTHPETVRHLPGGTSLFPVHPCTCKRGG